MDRRRFIKNVAQSTLILSTSASSTHVLGANERVNVGLIGCGGRGRFVARRMCNVPNVEFTAVCDVYERNLALAKDVLGSRCLERQARKPWDLI